MRRIFISSHQLFLHLSNSALFKCILLCIIICDLYWFGNVELPTRELAFIFKTTSQPQNWNLALSGCLCYLYSTNILHQKNSRTNKSISIKLTDSGVNTDTNTQDIFFPSILFQYLDSMFVMLKFIIQCLFPENLSFVSIFWTSSAEMLLLVIVKGHKNHKSDDKSLHEKKFICFLN